VSEETPEQRIRQLKQYRIAFGAEGDWFGVLMCNIAIRLIRIAAWAKRMEKRA
jgi:hypothetical protein